MTQQRNLLDFLRRRHRSDPDNRSLQQRYHRHLRRVFPASLSADLEDGAAWLTLSSLEKDAAAAFIAERLEPGFCFVTMTAARVHDEACLLPLFRHEASRLELALCPGSFGAIDEAPTRVERGRPFFARALPQLDFTALRRRIAEAAAWQLRQPSFFWPKTLNPMKGPKSHRLEIFWRMASAPAEARDAVEALVKRRSSIVGEQPLPKEPEGRLLIFDLGSSLWDGAADPASAGFFDDNNLPAWESWVLYVEDDNETPPGYAGPALALPGYLLAWVARDRIPFAQAGLDVNPEGCIFWAKDSPGLLPKLWAAEGFSM